MNILQNNIGLIVILFLLIYLLFFSLAILFIYNPQRWLNYEKTITKRFLKNFIVIIRWIAIVCLPLPYIGIWFKTKHKNKYNKWVKQMEESKKIKKKSDGNK